MVPLRISAGENGEIVACDRMAGTKDNLVSMLSIVAGASTMRAVLAAFRLGNRRGVSCSGPLGILVLDPVGYSVATSRFPLYDTVHAIIQAKSPKYIYGDLKTSLQAYLMSSAINTPILPGWLDWVASQVVEYEAIERLNSYSINAYFCNFESDLIDAIVTDGLRRKILVITTEQEQQCTLRLSPSISLSTASK